MSEKVEYLLSLRDAISAGLDNILKKGTKVDAKMDDIGGKSEKAGKKGTSAFSGMGASIGRLAALAGIGVLTAKIVRSGLEMEQTRVSFATFLGSAEKGNAVIKDLVNFSNVTPFTSDEVLKAGKGLTAFGTKTEALIPTLKAIGDISAGTGKDFNELATIYGKAQVAGTLYAEDINQLVEAGIPIMGEFAKALGVSEDQVKKMASTGALKFSDLQTAFSNLTKEGSMFGGLMEKQSQTLGGLWSTLVGKFESSMAGLGESTQGPLKDALSIAIGFMDFLMSNLDGLKRVFAPITKAFEPLIAVFDKIKAKFSEAGDSASIFKSIFNGIGFVLEFISPLIESVFSTLAKIIDVVFQVSDAFVGWFKRTEWAQTLFKGLVATVISGFVYIGQAAQNILGGVGDLLVGIFSGNLDKIKSGLTSLNNVFSDAGSASEKAFNDSFNTGMKDNFGETKTAVTARGKDKTLADFINPSSSRSTGKTAKEKSKKESSSSVDGVSGGRPTNIVVNITKLVETLQITTSTLNQSESEIKALISRALVSAVNDVNLIAG
jgi:tape measure domain-containing protein